MATSDAWHPPRARGDDARHRHEANVELIEPTGFGIILHLSLHGLPFKIFTLNREALTAGPEVKASVSRRSICTCSVATAIGSADPLTLSVMAISKIIDCRSI
jgi:hypothetical protein